MQFSKNEGEIFKIVNLGNGQRNYLQVRLSVTYQYLNKQLFVPLILHIYPYGMYNSPPKIMLITNNGKSKRRK